MLELHKTNTAKLGSKALQETPSLAARGGATRSDIIISDDDITTRRWFSLISS
jgi:hypothetical protein